MQTIQTPLPQTARGKAPNALSVVIIGGGISGLSAAHALASHYRVTVFEAELRLGGHSRTRIAGRKRQVAVDTGFIVFNYRNYPSLVRLLKALKVPVKPSDMAFSACIDDGAIEYGLHATSALFGQARNACRPSFWRMLADIPRFNKGAKAAFDEPDLSLGQLMDRLGMGEWFRRYFMLPLGSAIWSASIDDMLDFPAASFVRFFENHGLLTLHGQPQWYTVDGGSQVYVEKLTTAIRARGGLIRTGAPVECVARFGSRAEIKAKSAPVETFDLVVFACHAPQVLQVLSDASGEEQAVLSKLRTAPNRVVLHDDARQMPTRRACWASWNYRGKSGRTDPSVAVTYWMNRLQDLPTDVPLFVSLNPTDPIPEKHIFDETVLYHPQFDREAIAAQAQLGDLQGQRGTYFCGAYTRYGFHEDGLVSGLAAAEAIKAKRPLSQLTTPEQRTIAA